MDIPRIHAISGKQRTLSEGVAKNNHGDVIYTQNNLTVTKHYDYDPFGNEINPDPNDTNPFRYCGEYFDVHSGTYYLRNRYYYPRLGRFTTIDPIKDGNNWYVYCSNNPLVFVDPFGLAWTESDERVYQKMCAMGNEASAMKFKTAIENSTQRYLAAEGDRGKMTLAHLEAVSIRRSMYNAVGQTYVDDYDYTYGEGTMVYVGVHEVMAGNYHTSVIVMVSPQSSLYQNSNLIEVEQSNMKYVTLGAGPSEGLTGAFFGILEGDFNREKDILFGNKSELIAINNVSIEQIDGLLSTGKHYKNNQKTYGLNYEFFPDSTSPGYNSNSFTSGLLNANDIKILQGPTYNVPGWNKPVPDRYFGK